LVFAKFSIELFEVSKKLITRLIGAMSHLIKRKISRSSAKGTFSNLDLNKGGVKKTGVYPPISRSISETVTDRSEVAIDTIGSRISSFRWYKNH